MQNKQVASFMEASGTIRYNMTNNYMFRYILQKNKKVLKGLICSLLHLEPEQIKKVEITNPINLSGDVTGKEFILDINVMLNVKNHLLYSDKFTLSVVNLNQIELATDEDKVHNIDYWASIFKAKTWEELKMLAKDNEYLQEAVESLYAANADEIVRQQCRAREDAERLERTLKRDNKLLKELLAERDATIADKDARIAELEAQLANK